MSALSEFIREVAVPLTGAPYDYDPVLELVGNAQFVLLGEASHGTHEFYRERAEITRRLIREKGFNAVAVEADWPDAYRVNRFVRGESKDAEAVDALDGFKRFPQWMWRNADVLDFVGWLREHNDAQQSPERKTGFYGLDLYSLHASIEAVLAYLERHDPDSAKRARKRYACFDHFGGDTQKYGMAAGLGVAQSCEEEVINELTELRLREAEYLQRDGRVAADEFFSAEQNAFIIRNAEEYYRTMFRGEVSSWNLRDQHMMETLNSLVKHLKQFMRPVKVVVWAHNSHLGNARATEMGERGEFNLGQLARERHGHHAVLIGFTTHHGTVTAASDWDGPAERKHVRPALSESYEALFHEVGYPAFWLEFEKYPQTAMDLRGARLERAIGVIYRPETERISHYFMAQLPDQFDAVLHFDETRAVEPLERTAEWEAGHVEETFPSGL
ncbi:MAG TPA: erythromycin esterase family protein [Verrucomicrobiae bacterium]|nr:erythromycin esterase family protein [Verrucomicrobiae bacterium]